ncbi:type VI secretion system Vgr family protein [Pseudomonas fluorescens]|uniref:type VI secretion system Vgr family protein n=1 Tax=Pseudomonas fluorescens TaxID=294 RepID=UPI00259B68EB|nr:contractile injection system protein, VgrG/Pvc8 family [Pseudomonas fluorescens]WJK07962.1 contractile injection system protein, VgrG/Pvc8 family [Pseudomonas fluorescens]
MLNDKESPFSLTLAEGGINLPVLRFSGHEALNQPYRFEIEVMGLAPAWSPGTLLYQAAFLHLDDDHGIHGIIQSASCEHRATHRIAYQLVLMPHLQALEQHPVRRVFTQLNVPAILEQLLSEHHLPAHNYRIEMTVGHYPPRPFCIQYEETDLAFLQRLCEEEGIHYHFEHQPDGHVVVFADDSLSLPQQPTAIPFNTQIDAPATGLSSLFQRHEAVLPQLPTGVRERGQSISGQDAANHTLGGAVAPPGFLPTAQRHAAQRSRRLLERQRSRSRSIQGRSDCPRLLSGRLLQVMEHPVNAFNEQWLITDLRHQGQQPSILDPVPTVRRYHNDFTALPWSTPFRPPPKKPRPGIPGYQSAQVLGVPGQPAQVDGQGRIAVRLWPDQPDARASEGLWLPVVMPHAGSGLPRESLPCAGSEVWVSFLDSDPDRPILCLDACRPRTSQPTETEPDDDFLLDWLLNRSAPPR